MSFTIDGWDFEGHIDGCGDLEIVVWLPKEGGHDGHWVEPLELHKYTDMTYAQAMTLDERAASLLLMTFREEADYYEQA